MDPLEAIAIFAAGIAAGAINTIVGSGTLITFPVLIALGYAPLVANVSNNIGLVPGAMSGACGYRRELAGQRERVLQLGAFSVVGAVIGATLLLVLPSSAFDAIVPALIAIALVLVVVAAAAQRVASTAAGARATAAAPSAAWSAPAASTAATSAPPRASC